MFKVYKNENWQNDTTKKVTWNLISEFETFEEAHEYAKNYVCPDVKHEGHSSSIYWFSDNENSNEGYKVAIDSSNWFK